MPEKIVFGHHPCTDGTAAMWAVDQAYPDEEITFVGMNYEDPSKSPDIIKSVVDAHPEANEIFFVDYVPNQAHVIQDLLDAGLKVRIMDHHQSSQHNIEAVQAANQDNPNLSVTLDFNRAGADIVWSELCPDREPSRLLKLVSKMDVISFDSELEEKAAAFIDDFRFTETVEDNMAMFDVMVKGFDENGIEQFAQWGEESWQRHADAADFFMTSRRDLRIGEQTLPTINITEVRDLGRVGVNRVTQTLTDDDQPACLMVKQTPHVISISVRTNPEHSEHTYDIIEDIKACAKEAADPLDKEKVTGGGRGVQGQIGQGVIRMPPSVAHKLGIIDKEVDRFVAHEGPQL